MSSVFSNLQTPRATAAINLHCFLVITNSRGRGGYTRTTVNVRYLLSFPSSISFRINTCINSPATPADSTHAQKHPGGVAYRSSSFEFRVSPLLARLYPIFVARLRDRVSVFAVILYMTPMNGIRISRVLWIVLDSVGIGPLPDAADYGDRGRDTLGHVARSRPLLLPTLSRLGLGNIAPLHHIPPASAPLASYGRGVTRSPGKDTTTGHWEMAGIWLDRAFPVYPHGFPQELMAEFERQIGRATLGNKPASGTEILKELGAEHIRTGRPIVYTSGDSVFQIAAHEDVIPLAELYRGRGVENYVTTKNNSDGMEKIAAALAAHPHGLIFANLVDFDMLFGHRKDVEGFARSLEEFDVWLETLLPRLAPLDLLLLTADHGCDPCPCSPSTDHSREYVPILACAPRRPGGRDLGTRPTLADMGQTVAEIFGGNIPHGTSFLGAICDA